MTATTTPIPINRDVSRAAGATRHVACDVEPDASCTAAALHKASRSTTAQLDASPSDNGGQRVCAWCSGPIPAAVRRDAVCCSVRCRQARHRFTRTVGAGGQGVAVGQPLRLAYADPPYPGNARLYRGHRDYAGEVNHQELIRHLMTYDGWALSTSATALPAVLALCPPDVRVAAWHRGERPTPSKWPLSAWEPVIYTQGRPSDLSRRSCTTRRVDSLVHGVSAMTTLPGRVIGAKPAAFCRWLFDLLSATPGDSFDDLFPGSGAVSRAWAVFAGSPVPSPAAESDASPPAENDASPGPHDASSPPAYTTADRHPEGGLHASR
ncbi:hypothetical protein AB0F17_37670 [Nonomuraea sp. NPDC026600]|uniref:hypothetical protein n=1 Tax=Nonomuraea sp. NPDC026600 TaxID=3155363 RepID=UPI0033EA889E